MNRVATPLGAPPGVPPWWDGLHRSADNASVFLSAAWIGTWLEVYGGDFQGQWVHWREGESVVGGCLLVTRVVRRRLVPLRALFLNATGEATDRTPLAEFNAILCLPGYEAPVAADFLALLRTLDWDCLFLSGYEDCGQLDRIAADIPTAMLRRESRPAPFVDLAALAAVPFENALSANTRGQLRRTRKLYEERSGRLELRVAASLDEALAFLDEVARLHNSRWESKGKEGSFASASVSRFHRLLVSRLWEEGAADLVRVRAGERDIGYLYNFRDRGKVSFFQSGFVYEDDARLKPGLLTHALAIGHYADGGLREYDFLAGDAQYKRSLARQSRTLHWTVIFADKAWIRLALALWRMSVRVWPARVPP